jgi:hypothetical protein
MSDEVRILSVKEILEAPDIEERVLFVPQWKGSVRLRSFTQAQMQGMRSKATRPVRAPRPGQPSVEVDNDHLQMLLVVGGVVEPEFGEGDILALKQKNTAAVELISRVLLEMSGLGQAAVEAAEARFPG